MPWVPGQKIWNMGMLLLNEIILKTHFFANLLKKETKMKTTRFLVSLAANILAIGAVLGFILIIANQTAFASSDVLYVATGGNCGHASPCYSSIQDAVDAAQEGDEIRISSGTYSGVNNSGALTQTVYISKTILLQGGYTVTNWTTPDPVENQTTLDAMGLGRVVFISGDITPTITGFLITGGNAYGQGGKSGWDCGGGIHIITATADIHDNVVYDNNAMLGAGIYLQSSDSHVESNTIISNSAEVGGGGISINESPAALIGNYIAENKAQTWAGGIHHFDGAAVIRGNTIISNTSDTWGGGLSLSYNKVEMSENIVAANDALNCGGISLYIMDESTLINNVFMDNGADGYAEEICVTSSKSELIHNTIVAQNETETAIIVNDFFQATESNAVFTNTIISGYSVGISVTGSNTATINGILWHDTPITVTQSPTATVIIQNQVTGDPGFASDGYHITPASAAMDAGVVSGIDKDIDGNDRPYNDVFDMGADEIMAVSVTPDTESSLTVTDTNGTTTIIQIPAGAVTDTMLLEYSTIEQIDEPAGLKFLNTCLLYTSPSPRD